MLWLRDQGYHPLHSELLKYLRLTTENFPPATLRRRALAAESEGVTHEHYRSRLQQSLRAASHEQQGSDSHTVPSSKLEQLCGAQLSSTPELGTSTNRFGIQFE